MRPAVPALFAALLAGVALAQPSQKQHLTPPGVEAPAKPGAEAPAPARAPDWPALPPRPADEPPGVAALRGLLGPDVAFGYRAASQAGDEVTLLGAELRREGSRLLIERLLLNRLTPEGLARAEARGVRAETPEGPFAVEAIDVAGLALLPLDPGQAPADRMPHQVAIEALAVTGFTLGGPQRASLGRLDLANWRPGQPTRLALQGLDVALPPGGPVDRLRLDRAGVEGHDLALLLGAAIRGETPPAPGTGRQVKLAEGLVVLREGRAVGGIARLLADSETAADGAARARLQVHDAFIEDLPGAEVLFDAIGLRRLSLELAVEGSYVPETRRLAVPTFGFGVRDLGALALGGVFEGIEPGPGMPDPEQVRLLVAGVRYLDQSLYGRVVANEARTERIPEARVRQRHAQMVAAALTDARADAALDALREALLRFVRGEAREIEITLNPTRAVPLAEIPQALGAGPAELVRLLGLRVTAR
jgi:hypothetical protein